MRYALPPLRLTAWLMVLAPVVVFAHHGVASADEATLDPKSLVSLPPPQLDGSAPKLSVVSPAMDAEVVGRKNKDPVDKYSNLECLQNSKKFSIKIAAENWEVKPGGKGVLLVVDGVYARVLHDLAKPVLVADLEPYELIPDSEPNAQGPMHRCGEHWIALVPTAANGQMLPVAPAVSWWRNVSQDIEHSRLAETDRHRSERLRGGLPVVNWPLLGSLYVGTSWSVNRPAHRSGMVVADPKRVVFDWTIARGTESDDSCALKITAQNDNQAWTLSTGLPERGTVILPSAYVDQAIIVDSTPCKGVAPYYVKLWSKRPSPASTFKWPTPSGVAADDYWTGSGGHQQMSSYVKSQKAKCAKGNAEACEKYRSMSGKH